MGNRALAVFRALADGRRNGYQPPSSYEINTWSSTILIEAVCSGQESRNDRKGSSATMYGPESARAGALSIVESTVLYGVVTCNIITLSLSTSSQAGLMGF